ncbi:MutS-related protein [Nocardia stercoris]|nr:hypothetical protein [Nocardia stercoris]
MQETSVLWATPYTGGDEPILGDDTLTDLALDQVIADIVGAPDEFGLTAVFARPVTDPATVRLRQDIFDDLVEPGLRSAADEFALGMRRLRLRAQTVARATHPQVRHRAILDAATDYLTVVRALAAALAAADLTAAALHRLRDRLDTYIGSSEFADLTAAVERTGSALAAVRLTITVRERTVEVGTNPGTDYSGTVAALFAPFGVTAPAQAPPTPAVASPLDELVAERAAAIHPEAFALLDEFAREHADFLAPALVVLDRELQFYLRFRAFADRVCRDGLRLCRPRIVAHDSGVEATDAFDLALAAQRVRTRHVVRRPGGTEPAATAPEPAAPAREPVVCNDFRLDPPERLLVVTGPNQGGKTTFARTFGQLVHFAALGCPVAATSARLPLADRLRTHFGQPEQPGDPDGRLLTELRRMREILDVITDRSVVVLNESFAGTTATDTATISHDILTRLLDTGPLGVWVTFTDTLTDAGPAVVGMVAATDPADPARRTYRIHRRPTDTTGHVALLIQRYRLTYADITARMGDRA